MLMPDQTEPASERPNAGQDEGCGADGCTSFGGCVVCVREAAFEEGRGSMADAVADANRRAEAAETELREAKAQLEEWTLQENDQARRAEAAEAKLAVGHAMNKTLGAGLLTLERERDAALSKLDAVADHAGSFHAAMLGPVQYNPDQVRVRAVAALDGIRDVLTDQSPAAVVERTTTEHEETGQ